MKKLLSILAILILITGCSDADVEKAYRSGLSQALPTSTNHKKPYYRYYLPPHVGTKVQDQISSILMVDGYEVLMNLKVEYIVGNEFDYEVQEKESIKTPQFEESTTYVDASNKMQTLNVRVYELNDGNMAVFVDNNRIEMVSVVPKTSLNLTLETMIIITKSTEVNDSAVVAAYSNKEIATNSGTYSEFFEQVPPETGTLKEMYDRINPDNQE